MTTTSDKFKNIGPEVFIKVTENKAYSIVPFSVDDEEFIGIRQMYKTRKDPDFRPGKSGISIGRGQVSRIIDALTSSLASLPKKKVKKEDPVESVKPEKVKKKSPPNKSIVKVKKKKE